MIFSSRVVVRVLCVWSLVLAVGETHAAELGSELPGRKPITVVDVIQTTRFVEGPVFSPDGSRFAVLVKQGDVEKDSNHFTLLLYRTKDAFVAPRGIVLVKMSCLSNRDGISHVRWLGSGETLVFVGENGNEVSQVYSVDIDSHRLRRLTNVSSAVVDFDITSDGRTLLFETEPLTLPVRSALPGESHHVIPVDGHNIDDLVSRNYSLANPSNLIFLKQRHCRTKEIKVSAEYYVSSRSTISLSPDGRYVVIGAALFTSPPNWTSYRDRLLQKRLAVKAVSRTIYPWSVPLLYDSISEVVSPVLDAPAEGYFGKLSIGWGQRGTQLFVRTYLPLTGVSEPELTFRVNTSVNIVLSLPDRTVRRSSNTEWPKQRDSPEPINVTLAQDVNTPPKLYVSRQGDKQHTLLLDLNPQFSRLQFGRVQVIVIKLTSGLQVRCGLYLPPDYVVGKRYPLLIQTHGFVDTIFSMDGSFQEWSSAFAARPLVAKGVLVLQVFDFVDRAGEEHYNDGGEFGVTEEQAGRNLSVAVIEQAVQYLDGKGMIDPARIGLSGFSRTVGVVAYLLTHSRVHFAAATLVDGVDYGYFQTIAFPAIAWDVERVNGNEAPFGLGLKTWMKESPSFSLDVVNAPVRLVALRPSGVLAQWEWYASLSLQGKPVDFILIPDEDDGFNHFLVKPWERRIALEGLVDWFVFWLKGEEDADPHKREQYVRWRMLRMLEFSAHPSS